MTRTSSRACLLFVALAASAITACKYDPHPKDGTLYCGPGGECPRGYSCQAPGTCWSNTLPAASTVGCDGTTSFAVNNQVIRSCLLRLGCNPFEPASSISACVTFNFQDALPGQRCNLTSQTCADYQTCEGFGVAGTDLCTGQNGGSCVGTKAINCATNGSYFLDCKKAGGSCRALNTSANAPTDCQVVASCTETDANSHCSGNFSYTCINGVGYGFSCGSQGYCDTQDGSCYFSGSTCGNDSDTCSGRIENFCSAGNLFKYDCGSVGLGCGANPAGGSWCLAPGCTVDDYTGSNCAEFCTGSQLTFCYGGVPYSVDCKNYGFNSCVDGLSNANLSNYAKCTN